MTNKVFFILIFYTKKNIYNMYELYETKTIGRVIRITEIIFR